MWINNKERLYRRKLEQVGVADTTRDANACIARANRGLRALLGTPMGETHLARLGFKSATLGRSSRMASNGAGEGTTVLEAVVVAGRIARLLEDAELVRWASRDCAEGLALLQQVAGHGKKPLGASVSARR